MEAQGPAKVPSPPNGRATELNPRRNSVARASAGLRLFQEGNALVSGVGSMLRIDRRRMTEHPPYQTPRN
jgi:hypothetical protein